MATFSIWEIGELLFSHAAVSDAIFQGTSTDDGSIKSIVITHGQAV